MAHSTEAIITTTTVATTTTTIATEDAQTSSSTSVKTEKRKWSKKPRKQGVTSPRSLRKDELQLAGFPMANPSSHSLDSPQRSSISSKKNVSHLDVSLHSLEKRQKDKHYKSHRDNVGNISKSVSCRTFESHSKDIGNNLTFTSNMVITATCPNVKPCASCPHIPPCPACPIVPPCPPHPLSPCPIIPNCPACSCHCPPISIPPLTIRRDVAFEEKVLSTIKKTIPIVHCPSLPPCPVIPPCPSMPNCSTTCNCSCRTPFSSHSPATPSPRLCPIIKSSITTPLNVSLTCQSCDKRLKNSYLNETLDRCAKLFLVSNNALLLFLCKHFFNLDIISESGYV